MTLRVLEPGLASLVVDFGRPHHRSLGVPVGGAADRAALAIGNALVRNAPDAAALEITLAGPTLRAEQSLTCVLHGTPFEMALNMQAIPAGKTFTMQAGDEVHIRGTPTGMRAYLCIHGGIQAEPILGSRSALQPVCHGEVLACLPSALPSRFLKEDCHTDASVILQHLFGLPPTAKVLRVLPGAQFDWFDAEEVFSPTFDFTWPPFEVTTASNRMGIRLRGTPLPFPPQELLSEPVCPGSVQVTRDGQCIILGVDGQTIGGYPKIAQVISADLDELGQLRPGDRIHFVRIDLELADRLYLRRHAELKELLTRIQAMSERQDGGPR
jgi:5-oxoprolinase (ATP-hydrolysing) subunit C